MLLKNKTFIAFTVKLLLAASCAQAQHSTDSVSLKNSSFTTLSAVAPPLKAMPLPTQLPGNYYAKQLPFFCNKELKIQKAVGFPIKFRVGSVEYCDKLEGKNR